MDFQGCQKHFNSDWDGTWEDTINGEAHGGGGGSNLQRLSTTIENERQDQEVGFIVDLRKIANPDFFIFSALNARVSPFQQIIIFNSPPSYSILQNIYPCS